MRDLVNVAAHLVTHALQQSLCYISYAFDASSNVEINGQVPNIARYLAICLSRFEFGIYRLCAK